MKQLMNNHQATGIEVNTFWLVHGNKKMVGQTENKNQN